MGLEFGRKFKKSINTRFFRKEGLLLLKVELMSERFMGTGKLASYENRSGDQVTYPLGKDPVGYIMYNPDGYMAVAIMASKRRRFSSSDPMSIPTEEMAAAASAYISYYGKYEVTEDKIIHLNRS